MSYLKQRAGEKDRPGIFKTKAEKGFIYGLPIVMNYAVMYADALDRNSAQFKATLNQLIVALFNAKTQTLLSRGVSQNALSNNGNKSQRTCRSVEAIKTHLYGNTSCRHAWARIGMCHRMAPHCKRLRVAMIRTNV